MEHNDGGSVAEPQAERPVRSNAFRRLYDWVLSWAETRHGPAALGALSFAESSFFPIPPDPLLVALAIGAPKRSFYFAFICTVASVTGGLAGYLIGAGLWTLVGDFFFQHVPGFTPEAFERVRVLYDRYDFWAIFVAGFTPIPYKVFTLSSGVFGISLPVFIVASIVSRGLRFFLVGGLIYFFGPGIQVFIDKHFDRLIWLFLLLLIGGFLLIEYLL